MALSLADELAAFDDQPREMGGGLSLAEEFGLDMDMGGEDDETDRGESSDQCNPLLMLLGLHQDQLDDDERRPVLHRKASFVNGYDIKGDSPPNARVGTMGLPSAGESGTGRNGNGNGVRTAKSSSSTMYGTATIHSDHDGTDIDAMLDSTFDTSFETAPMDLSPGPSTRQISLPTTPSRLQNGHGQVQSGFMGHRAEKDLLGELEEMYESNQPFLDLLTHIDERGLLKTPTQTIRRTHESIEVKLQRHLERLHEEDKKREEQCRELALLARDLVGFRWDGEIELEIATGKGLGLGMIDEVEDDPEEEEDVGWNGDPRGVGVIPHFVAMVGRTTRENSVGLDVDDERDRLLGSPSPLSPTRSFSLLPGSSTDGSASKLAPLPKTLRLLTSTTPDLIATLAGLSDILHSTTSFSTSSSRNLRGIRAGIDSWKDRDTQEELARKGVEEFERKRLEVGLKGYESGESVKVRMDREVKGFESVLNGLQGRMEKLQRESAMRMALR